LSCHLQGAEHDHGQDNQQCPGTTRPAIAIN
jgi:hypothetical protein